MPKPLSPLETPQKEGSGLSNTMLLSVKENQFEARMGVVVRVLGKEIPEKSFPRVFEKKQYRQATQKMQKIRGRRAVQRASVFAATVAVVVGIGCKVGLNLILSSFIAKMQHSSFA
jgi:hypothetical protein